MRSTFETGSRNRSHKEGNCPPKPLERGTARHRSSGEPHSAPHSNALQTLENQRQKSARIEREISQLLEAYPGHLPERVSEKVRGLMSELGMTRAVVHEYELRMKAAG
jgi:hypothetical protein